MAGKPGKFNLTEKNSKNEESKDKKPWKKPSRTIAFWVIIFLLSIIGVKFMDEWGTLKERPISYTQLKKIINDPQVGVLKIFVVMGERSMEIHGTIDKGSSKIPSSFINNKEKTFDRFVTNVPQNVVDNATLKEWEDRGIVVEFKEQGLNVMSFLYSMLPWLLILFVWFIFIRQMQTGGQKGIFSFGKSRAKLVNQDRPKITFEDVAGCDEAKEELEEIIEFLKDPKKFKRLGGKIPKGVLLLGAPGTGKTLLAKAVAGEAKVPFFSMSGSDFVEMFVGVGASRVRDLFEQSKKSAPCIIFIDEIDAVGRHRGAGLGGGHDEREQTLNQLLVEMDGFETNDGVIIIAATNRPDVLDPALLRPGRFDRQIIVDRPDIKGREGILKVHTKNIPVDEDVNLTVIARGTPGFSGADLANLVNEAALLAARYDQKKVTMVNFEDAKDKVMMGTERRSRVINDKEKKITAYHEAGHALIQKFIPNADPVHKVTIIPRGLALGVTVSLPKDDRYMQSREYAYSMIAGLLGGRQAEWLIFNERSTGCSNDIERATEIARRMVCEWGMSDKMGPITFGKKDEEIFLGRSITQHRDYSEQTAQEIDKEVRKIVEDQLVRVDKILLENKDKLILLAEAVLEYEILDGDEIDKVMLGEKIELSKRSRDNGNAKKSKKKEAKAPDKDSEEIKKDTDNISNGDDSLKGLNVDEKV